MRLGTKLIDTFRYFFFIPSSLSDVCSAQKDLLNVRKHQIKKKKIFNLIMIKFDIIKHQSTHLSLISLTRTTPRPRTPLGTFATRELGKNELNFIGYRRQAILNTN